MVDIIYPSLALFLSVLALCITKFVIEDMNHEAEYSIAMEATFEELNESLSDRLQKMEEFEKRLHSLELKQGFAR